jgi:hypothetical protein
VWRPSSKPIPHERGVVDGLVQLPEDSWKNGPVTFAMWRHMMLMNRIGALARISTWLKLTMALEALIW